MIQLFLNIYFLGFNRRGGSEKMKKIISTFLPAFTIQTIPRPLYNYFFRFKKLNFFFFLFLIYSLICVIVSLFFII